MCKRPLLAISILIFSSLAWGQQYVPGEVIVKLKSRSGSSESYAFLGKASVDKSMRLKQSWGKMNMYHFALQKGQTVESAISDLKKDPDVAYAEPNYLIGKMTEDVGIQQTFTAEQVAQAAAQSQGFVSTEAPIGEQSVWQETAVSSAKPVVAVIDTGLDTTHYVFRDSGAVWINPNEIPANGIDDDGNGYIDDVNGWNFVDNSGSMYDDDGHGTHVSGIILSEDQDIFASTLRPAKIQIMPLKFLNRNGVGSTSDAIRAIYYAVNNGATVLNNSWGGTNYSAALHEAIAYTYSKGALFVAAAGNAGMNNDSSPMYPANYDVPNVISIAATTDYDYLASFSNYGANTVHIASPGVYIKSTYPGGSFVSMSGTSMATPFVSGTAAQMKVQAPDMLGYQLKTILMGRNASLSQLSGKVQTSGRLDSASAVSYAKVAQVAMSQPSYNLELQADRGLASNVTAGGCGTVHALDEGGPTSWGGAATVLLFVLAPAAVLIVMRMRAPQLRRKHERFNIDSDVRISVGDRELVGSVSSISLGGACVNTSALLQDGGLVTLTIAAPGGNDKVEVSGRVVWSEANKSYGVAFAQAPQSVLSRIADWTKGLQKAS